MALPLVGEKFFGRLIEERAEKGESERPAPVLRVQQHLVQSGLGRLATAHRAGLVVAKAPLARDRLAAPSGPTVCGSCSRFLPMTEDTKTLRDEFAIIALTALVARPITAADQKLAIRNMGWRAYAIADAMMKARAPTPEGTGESGE